MSFLVDLPFERAEWEELGGAEDERRLAQLQSAPAAPRRERDDRARLLGLAFAALRDPWNNLFVLSDNADF